MNRGDRIYMKQQSIASLKTLFAAGNVTAENILALKLDERKGVQQLIATYAKKQQQAAKLADDFYEMGSYERQSLANGYKYIAGIDEAGRGPLAGPVVAAAVILPPDFMLLGLTDSKKLNEKTRDEFYEVIVKEAISYRVAVISNQVIDQINILEATKQAMRTCLAELDPEPDHVLIDSVKLDDLPYSSESIIKGDQKSITIAAASVLAKVSRDRLMTKIHDQYPMYDFKSHRGYGTKHHLAMLAEYGVTEHHRTSFSPVSDTIRRFASV